MQVHVVRISVLNLCRVYWGYLVFMVVLTFTGYWQANLLCILILLIY